LAKLITLNKPDLVLFVGEVRWPRMFGIHVVLLRSRASGSANHSRCCHVLVAVVPCFRPVCAASRRWWATTLSIR
jgi:hypothetical protein